MDKIGILDPEGNNKNPLNNESYSKDYKKLAKLWSNFPAYKGAKDYIKYIKNNQVILVQSSTGSGKTVLFPKYALHSLDYKGKIAITLPKQIIAKSAAEFAAKTLDTEVGKDVGYQYKGSDKSARGQDTKLLYATDGTIVARLLNDPELKDFDMVIVDEAHERKIQIDFLLYLLKNALRKRKDFKVIIMSATINADLFAGYFSEFKYKEIKVEGERLFPIESIFLERPIPEKQFISKGIEIILDILQKTDKGDIMFFVTSSNEARDVCKMVTSSLNKNRDKYSNITCKDGIFCVEVYSGMKDNDQKLAQEKDLYKSTGDYCRKLVIATNVAESSLTIDGIKYVIDSGYELKSSYDAKFRARRLDREMISHAQASQRMGRAGRTAPGVCYHLYTQNEFDNIMERFPEPDIRTSDITQECLRLLNLDFIGTTDKLLNVLTEFIEPPRETYIKLALNVLNELIMIKDSKVTELGKISNNLGDPIASVAILMGKQYNCMREIIMIMSGLDASRSNFSDFFILPTTIVKRPSDGDKRKYFDQLNLMKKKFEKNTKRFKHKYGDHMSILKILITYHEKRRSHKFNSDQIHDWCYKHFLNKKTLEKSLKYYKRTKDNIYRNLPKELDCEGLSLLRSDKIKDMRLDERVLSCLLYGYRNQLAFSKDGGMFSTKYTDFMKIGLPNISFLKDDKSVDTAFYHELFISMGQANLNIVSKIPKTHKFII